MSNINLIIEERPASIGSFMVGRLLPFRDKRMVGPFAFIDHMGPTCMNDTENLDVPPHPHIGLSTLTYLFEGSIMHRDSLGNEIEIKPGQVNWMTAGKGIVHSERTPEYLRNSEKMMHGLQIWVALPKKLEKMEPEFFHVEGKGLPEWADGGVHFKLIAGEVLGRKSDVPVYSPLYFLELKSKSRQTVKIGKDLFGESALYILEGAIESEGNTFGPRQILVAKDSKLCEFDMQENTTIYIFGGEPFAENRIIYWNFVASTEERIEEAKAMWLEQSFPPVPGETEFVPLPLQSKNIKKQK
ncbi:MAG: pirin family protein [Candidatus Pedobacter colombiensis]|uniref:Pirin family protein n=1 Tax=Candidatus Pedobacter colombiensis TaxID=3121371 RepID=A0AAJ6B625_9SPHI|nr:pirin family protein [Pedobacter sp.]WEK18780.1 MAG: pirin family protein [Pedobacter sp.]